MIVWACEDCTIALECEGIPFKRPDMPRDYAMGLDCGIPNHWEDEPDEHSENCERRVFDNSACVSCGTTLAGYRFAYTVWED